MMWDKVGVEYGFARFIVPAYFQVNGRLGRSSRVWERVVRAVVCMQIHVLKSKIHRATITGASLEYEGSLMIDLDLMEQADLLPYERILCGNLANGERFETYAIPGQR